MEEVVTLVSEYFRVVELKIIDYVESARLKVESDRVLRESPELASRTLSFVDSTMASVEAQSRSLLEIRTYRTSLGEWISRS
jgi:hypothetical protein